MSLTSAYSLGLTGTTVEIVQEEFYPILNRIEAELHKSEIYSRTLFSLQSLAGEAAETIQNLVEAVGREAIKLAFGEFTNQVPLTSYKGDSIKEEEQPALVEPLETINSKASVQDVIKEDTASNEAIDLFDLLLNSFPQPQKKAQATKDQRPAASALVKPSIPASVSPKPSIQPKPITQIQDVIIEEDGAESNEAIDTFDLFLESLQPSKKLASAEKAEILAEQKRTQRLRQIGQQLQQQRISLSLTIDELNEQTFIPIHQIQALETGRIDLLPEDVFVRGFIRRLGNVLGLNGSAIAASLPQTDPIKSLGSSCYSKQLPTGFNLNSVHLYVGYAAFIAGGMGGLAWMTQQSKVAEIDYKPTVPSYSAASQSERHQQPVNPASKSNKTDKLAKPNMAPPETMGQPSPYRTGGFIR